MRIAVCANEEQKSEMLDKGTDNGVDYVWLDKQCRIIEGVDACIDLLFDETNVEKNIFVEDIPVFANATIVTSSKLPANYLRINAWTGFLNREIVEVSTSNQNIKEMAEEILHGLQWKFLWTPDEPGMISARIISLVINEAYFALGEKVSTKEEIDVAMKLGTNYPYGPFEWSKRIGSRKIFLLLKKMEEEDKRYEIAPLLLEEASKQL
jgi:3-hydroxybutyryl-CoA dehydrogenase